jgi:hypothetical protein
MPSKSLSSTNCAIVFASMVGSSPAVVFRREVSLKCASGQSNEIHRLFCCTERGNHESDASSLIAVTS